MLVVHTELGKHINVNCCRRKLGSCSSSSGTVPRVEDGRCSASMGAKEAATMGHLSARLPLQALRFKLSGKLWQKGSQ